MSHADVINATGRPSHLYHFIPLWIWTPRPRPSTVTAPAHRHNATVFAFPFWSSLHCTVYAHTLTLVYGVSKKFGSEGWDLETWRIKIIRITIKYEWSWLIEIRKTTADISARIKMVADKFLSFEDWAVPDTRISHILLRLWTVTAYLKSYKSVDLNSWFRPQLFSLHVKLILICFQSQIRSKSVRSVNLTLKNCLELYQQELKIWNNNNNNKFTW